MDDRGMTREQWRTLAVSAYLPTSLSMVGHSAVVPLLPLTARDLGSSVAQAALVVALLGIGTLAGAIPAGVVADRFGEKRAIVGACLLEAACMVAAALAGSVWMLALVAVTLGATNALFGLARQGYLTHAVPIQYRARAMSTLGGVFRIGAFVGPLLGAAMITAWGLRAAYVLATATSLVAAAVTVSLPDLESDRGGRPTASETSSAWGVLHAHVRTYLTVGVGAAALALVRVARDGLVPLWSDAVGLVPAQTSLVFGLSAGADMLLFYLGGSLMDRHGRRAVAVPAMLIMGTCLALLPLATTFWAMVAVAVGLGLGNGISAGVVLTLGSDYAPPVGVSHFLAGWRLTVGMGQAAGPLLISAIALVAPLWVACVAMGALGWAGAAWLWRWAVPDGGERQSPTASLPRRTISGSGS